MKNLLLIITKVIFVFSILFTPKIMYDIPQAFSGISILIVGCLYILINHYAQQPKPKDKRTQQRDEIKKLLIISSHKEFITFCENYYPSILSQFTEEMSTDECRSLLLKSEDQEDNLFLLEKRLQEFNNFLVV